jgi:hypothetical protein
MGVSKPRRLVAKTKNEQERTMREPRNLSLGPVSAL